MKHESHYEFESQNRLVATEDHYTIYHYEITIFRKFCCTSRFAYILHCSWSFITFIITLHLSHSTIVGFFLVFLFLRE